MSLLDDINDKTARLGVPFNVQLDLTYRCNENCVHCYLDHGEGSEMDTAEVTGVLDQLADAGTLFLCLSGGEILLRPDLLEIIRRARSLMFSVTVKTNGILLTERDAECLAGLSVSQVHISVYSHKSEVHDAITRVPRSFDRSLSAIRLLVRLGVRVRIANVLMRENVADYQGVQALAAELGVEARIDPTVTPALDGDASATSLRIPISDLERVFRDPAVVKDVEKFCAPPPAADAGTGTDYLCGAGINGCYVSPSGDVMPCVAFPLVCGNLRRRKFLDIWRESEVLGKIRAARVRDLPACRECVNVPSCTRCPGLAYLAGDMLGPSLLDCEKAYARTGLLAPRCRAPADLPGSLGLG
jgi:radical SAM protein with 4Fe4S-binding SPASM domain